MITDGNVRGAITSVAKRQRTNVTLTDPGERGGGRLSMQVRAAKGKPTAEWYVTWQRDGERRSAKLGSYPTTSLAEARRTFREEFQPPLLDGRDPVGARFGRRKSDVPTVERLFEAYVGYLEKQNKAGASRFRYVLLGPSGAAAAIGPDRPVCKITAEDIFPHLKGIFDRGKPDYAEYNRACLRAAFQYGLKSKYDVQSDDCGAEWGLRTNPVDSIRRIKRSPPRDRLLSPAEFRALWHWLDSKRHEVRYRNAAAIMLMMLTGQRPGEILGLTGSQYDRHEQSLYWKTTKNGRSHSIPLCRQAALLLSALQVNEHDLYFPRQRLTHKPSIVDLAANVLDAYWRETDAERFQLRDLRRTWKSIAGDAGIGKEACDRLQNHSYRDVGSIHYDRSDHWSLKSRAVDQLSLVLDAILYSRTPVSRRSLGRMPEVIESEAKVVSRQPLAIG